MVKALKMTACAGFLLAAVSCDIGFGGTPFTLQVFWVPQQTPYYCVPASIHMWALYDDADVIGQAASVKAQDNLDFYGANTRVRGSNYHFQV